MQIGCAEAPVSSGSLSGGGGLTHRGGLRRKFHDPLVRAYLYGRARKRGTVVYT
jgi:hypothetical protein